MTDDRQKRENAEALAIQALGFIAADPELLATAQNYWLYTNRHLMLTRELQAQARQLAESLEKE